MIQSAEEMFRSFLVGTDVQTWVFEFNLVIAKMVRVLTSYSDIENCPSVRWSYVESLPIYA
jgi:hypothetical protein